MHASHIDWSAEENTHRFFVSWHVRQAVVRFLRGVFGEEAELFRFFVSAVGTIDAIASLVLETGSKELGAFKLEKDKAGYSDPFVFTGPVERTAATWKVNVNIKFSVWVRTLSKGTRKHLKAFNNLSISTP